MRFGDDRIHALLGCVLKHRLHADGFSNAHLRRLIAEATGRNPDQITAHQMSYDLRRLRVHGLIQRIPGRFRYQLTQDGLAIGVAYTLAYDRIIRTELSLLLDTVISSDLRRSFERFAVRSCLAA